MCAYVGNSSTNIVFEMTKDLWTIRIYQRFKVAPHGAKSGDRAWPLKIASKRDEPFGEVITQDIHWPSCRVSRGAILLKPHFPYIRFFKFGQKKIHSHADIPFRIERNCSFVLFKGPWVNNAGSGYCTLNSHTIYMQKLFMKFPRVSWAPISHVLFVHTSWNMEMCLVTKENKSVLGQVFEEDFTCIFSRYIIAWIKLLHHCQFVWVEIKFLVKNSSPFNFQNRRPMFFGVLTVLEGPLSLNVSTHKQTDFWSGTRPAGAMLKWFLKARGVAMIKRLLLCPLHCWHWTSYNKNLR